MRVVLQRVSRASVKVENETVGEIGRGYLLLVGIGLDDGAAEMEWMAEKIAGLRIFPDAEGKMNRDLSDVGGAILAVSQFTLYGDCRRGRRPGFTGAAAPGEAEPLFEQFIGALRARGFPVGTGRFGASMKVALDNDGPVTLILERERGSV